MTNIQLQEDQSNWSIFIDRIPFTIIRDEMSNSFFAYTDNLECAGRGETLEDAVASLHAYIVYFILYNISINNIDILNKNLGTILVVHQSIRHLYSNPRPLDQKPSSITTT